MEAARNICDVTVSPMLGLPDGTLNMQQEALEKLMDQDDSAMISRFKFRLRESVKARLSCEQSTENREQGDSLNMPVLWKDCNVKKDRNLFAWSLVEACGFDSNPLCFTGSGGSFDLKHKFNLLSREVSGPCDLYVSINTTMVAKPGAPRKVLILFEETPNSVGEGQDYMAQILGELIMVQHSHIVLNHLEGSVAYCMRMRFHYVQFFALRGTRQAFEALCYGDPNKAPLKLILQTSSAVSSKGHSLADDAQRSHVMRIASAIRQDMMK